MIVETCHPTVRAWGVAAGTENSPECSDRFHPIRACWICEGRQLRPTAPLWFDFDIYHEQDPELASYSRERLWLNRCQSCGFMQPAGLPALPNFFARMYDTRWSAEWVADEFQAIYRDPIFRNVLRELNRRVPSRPRRLLDIGAHVGRFVHAAAEAGWESEGLELNPTTAAFAAQTTGRPIHQCRAGELAHAGQRFDAITILDVLEHIPEPVDILSELQTLLNPGGCIAVKVPCGINQFRKERVRELLRPGYRLNLANNLVHVNHFTPGSLTRALERAGFSRIRISIGAPERHPNLMIRSIRNLVFAVSSRIPAGVHTPFALNLQAYAHR